MRNLTEELAQAREAALVAKVMTAVRAEIAAAFQALAREAAHLDAPYETAELDSRALSNIKEAAEGAARRLTCPHERYFEWPPGPGRCSRCGEPEPAPQNPFEPKPLDPDCNHPAFATEDGVTTCQVCEGVKPRG